MQYSFEDPKCDAVVAFATQCWKDFLDFLADEAKNTGLPPPTEFDIAQEMLDIPADRVSLFARRFADFCLVERPSRYGGPLIANVDVDWQDPTGNFTGPSWLFYSGVEIHIVLNETIAPLTDDTPACRKAATTLFLHELGHILLNWRQIEPPAYPAFVIPSDPDGERFAWWLCLEIIQINLGGYVLEDRRRRDFDYAVFALLG